MPLLLWYETNEWTINHVEGKWYVKINVWFRNSRWLFFCFRLIIQLHVISVNKQNEILFVDDIDNCLMRYLQKVADTALHTKFVLFKNRLFQELSIVSTSMHIYIYWSFNFGYPIMLALVVEIFDDELKTTKLMKTTKHEKW